MKKLVTITLLFTFVSCATKIVPPTACHMQLKEKIKMNDMESFNFNGDKEVVFNGDKVRYEGGMDTCTFYFFGCSYTETTIDKDNNIYSETSGLFGSKEKVGTLKGQKIFFEKRFLDNIAKISFVEISRKDRKVYTHSESKLINNLVGKELKKVSEGATFSPKCTDREVAIGSVTLNTAKAMRL